MEIQTPHGACLVHEERYPVSHLHGGLPLGACIELPERGIALLAKRAWLEPVDLRQAVFLDTETTGLAGGTGTAAFLVGIAHFMEAAPAVQAADPSSQSTFVIRQFFMRDFEEEPALLVALAEAVAPFRYLVTFNGKSFDLPLLATRYVLSRLDRPPQPELHFDLLHSARRLWRARLGSCSLGALEQFILGHRRQADVPSWMIPGLYAAYLQQGQAGPMHEVFAHNRHDLLSLAALMAYTARCLAEPLANDLGPDELLAVARLYDELGLGDEACACLEEAAAIAMPHLRPSIEALLAKAYRRAGRRDQAVELWQRLANGPSPINAMIELAKHLEHQERQTERALELVEQALAILEMREIRDGSGRWRAERADLEHRLARLLRKRGMPPRSF